MKIYIIVLVTISIMACSDANTPPTANTNSIDQTSNSVPDVTAVLNPCEVLADEEVINVFQIDTATFERYTRNPYPDTKRCEYSWSDPSNPAHGRQLTVTISANEDMAAMPRKYSNMLRTDLEKGLLATNQINIKPTPISDLGEYAYAWEQTQNIRVSKIKFQKNERYLVEIMFSTSDETLPNSTSEKLRDIGQLVFSKI